MSIWRQPLHPQQLGRRIPAGITQAEPKTSSDTGSGVDAKVTGNPFVSFPARSESGSGLESLPTKSSVFFETGSGSELSTLLATLARSDIGAGVEGLTLLALFLLSDTGAGVDSLASRIFSASEVGSGLESILSLLGKIASDAGTCSLENSYLHIIEGFKQSHETGTGVDASILRVLFGLHETGTGLETVIARALFTKELSTGAIDLAKLITAILTGHETGSGAEIGSQSYYQKVAETGSGSELSALSYLFKSSDSGIGAEAVTLLAAMIAHDTGMGVERVIARLLKLAESGMGAEVAQLVGLVGRAMKARMYTRPYFNTRLYMRPYYKTRLYIGEVKL